jgi:hypothetical protein
MFGSAGAPITYQNIYVLTPSSYINLQGYNNGSNVNNYSNVVLNNVYVNGSTLALNRIQSSEHGDAGYAGLREHYAEWELLSGGLGLAGFERERRDRDSEWHCGGVFPDGAVRECVSRR